MTPRMDQTRPAERRARKGRLFCVLQKLGEVGRESPAPSAQHRRRFCPVIKLRQVYQQARTWDSNGPRIALVSVSKAETNANKVSVKRSLGIYGMPNLLHRQSITWHKCFKAQSTQARSFFKRSWCMLSLRMETLTGVSDNSRTSQSYAGMRSIWCDMVRSISSSWSPVDRTLAK